MEFQQTAGWQRYIKLIVVLVCLALFGVGAWQYTEAQKRKKIEEASAHYETMLLAARNKEMKKAGEEAQQLVQEYSRTTYAPLASMMLARIAVEKGDTDKAMDHLKSAIQAGAKGPVEPIARVRLARILISESKYDEALKVLQDYSKDGYTTLIEEAKGDIYVKQNDLKKAKESYLLALRSAPQGVPTTLLQLKSADILEAK